MDKVGAFVSMGKEREDERRAAGILATGTDGRWYLKTAELERVYDVLGFDTETQSTRLRVLSEVRYGDL